MTVFTEHAPDAEAPSPPRPSWRKRVTILAVLGVVAVGIAAFAVNRTTTGDPGGTQALSVQRVAATRTACEQWLASTGPVLEAKPGSPWCAGMTSWMSDQMVAGRMMGTTMWNGPQSMREACRQWTAATAASATTEPCDQMVAWMSQHMGRWDGVHDWDIHMGDWGAGMMTR